MPIPAAGSRPLIQASVEFLESTLAGPPDQLASLSSGQIAVAVVPLGGDFATAVWNPVDSLTANTVEFEVGPGTDIGELALGVNRFRLRITDSSETPILDAGSLEVIA